MAWYDDPAIITIIIAVVVIIAVSACATILLAMRLKEKKPPQVKTKQTAKKYIQNIIKTPKMLQISFDTLFSLKKMKS